MTPLMQSFRNRPGLPGSVGDGDMWRRVSASLDTLRAGEKVLAFANAQQRGAGSSRGTGLDFQVVSTTESRACE